MSDETKPDCEFVDAPINAPLDAVDENEISDMNVAPVPSPSSETSKSYQAAPTQNMGTPAAIEPLANHSAQSALLSAVIRPRFFGGGLASFVGQIIPIALFLRGLLGVVSREALAELLDAINGLRRLAGGPIDTSHEGLGKWFDAAFRVLLAASRLTPTDADDRILAAFDRWIIQTGVREVVLNLVARLLENPETAPNGITPQAVGDLITGRETEVLAAANVDLDTLLRVVRFVVDLIRAVRGSGGGLMVLGGDEAFIECQSPDVAVQDVV